ncbi:MAG: leucine-rich repeat domain-containing protein, partial [Bacteroidaceae bacterium]|nr:leucine-rich repeat domain-containing protein [Bacteroidaceae bacterium]
MVQILSKTLRPLGLMLLCIATAMPAFAQLPTLPKSDGSYVISSDADYETFCKMVSTGNPYANAVLTADITVKTSIGSGDEQFHYRGTFDGQEHTIILNNFAEQGLFANTQPGCVIRNLHVAGTLNTDAAVAGSIVAKATGVTLENCISSVTVSAPKSEFCGGLIGQAEGECFLENCAFIGTLEARQTVCGLVGNNVQMLSVKSCYAAPQYAGSATTGALFTNRIVVFQENGVTEYQTFLNNYYCGTSLSIGTPGIATETTQDQLNNGQLCYLLNQNGRKGVVWFQHGNYPFPFQGDGGQLVTCENNQFVTGNACSHESYVNHVCPKCGALEEGAKLDPLQYCTTTTHTDNSYYVGNLRYTLDLNNHTATVTGVRNRDVVNAIHIPEAIRVNGEDYTVTSVTEPGFLKSVMEYCFVPKTVKLLGDNSFHECGKLKYLHIADCPSEDEKREDKLYMSLCKKHGATNEELFYDSDNLQKVYIGRDMRWDTSIWNTEGPDEPFEDRHSITDVFFGPCVSRVGNYLEEDARSGYSYDLFNDCEGIRRVYIMGDDASLNNKPMEFYSRDGLGWATDYYINRNITHTDYWEYSVLVANIMGCVDHCERVTYGPFVKTVTRRTFCATEAPNNHYLKSVDFTNAYRLEEIGDRAFNYCPDAKFTGLNGQYPLKKICFDAFYDCDNLETFDFGSEIDVIEANAFNDCDNLKVLVIPASLSTLKEKAFEDCENLQAVMFEDSEYSINFSTLSSNFDGCKKLATLHINREILYDQLNEDNNSPFSSASSTLTHVVIGPRVTMVGGGLLLGLDALSSVTFEYSPKPLRFLRTPGADLYTANGKGLTSLQINRRLVDNDGYDLIGPQWGEKISSHVAEITFGDEITSLRDRAFEGFTGLKVLILPPTMQSV